jgi:hypothetical protein
MALCFLAMLLAQTYPWNEAPLLTAMSDWQKYETARHTAVAQHKHLVVYVGVDVPPDTKPLEPNCEVVQMKMFTEWPTEKPPCILVSRWDEATNWHWWLATLPGQSSAAVVLRVLNPPPLAQPTPVQSC